MGKIVAVLNQKGGVTKTTTVLELGYEGGCQGLRVLIVDMDPQASATKVLLGRECKPSLYELMTVEDDDELLGQALKQADKNWPNTWVLPSDGRLGNIEKDITRLGPEGVLKRTLERVEENFDLILLDLPPLFGVLHTNALVAADAYLVPCDLSDFSRDGARIIKKFADSIRKKGFNPKLEFIGVALTLYQRQKERAKAYKALIADFKEEFGEKFLDVRIPHSVRATDARLENVPIGQLEKDSLVALAYKDLFTHVIGGRS